MSALAEVDDKAYNHILTNVFRNLTNSMLEHSSEEGQEALKHAATIVNQYVFGSTKFVKPGKLADGQPKKEESEDKVSEKEKAFIEKQFKSSINDLNVKVNGLIRNTIKANIDPKNSMSDYVRNAASRDVYDTVVDLIDRDSNFKKLVNRMWDAAAKNDFTDTSLKKINDAYVAKARTLLPSVIKKARAEALRGVTAKKVKDDDDDDAGDTKRKSSPPSKSRPDKSPDKNKYAGKSTFEAMMMED